MNVKRIALATMAMCAAVVIPAAPGITAQTPPAAQHSMDKMKPPADMAAQCKAMMAEHDKMMADMKAGDQRLDGLVAKMNGASGAQKTDVTAAVVTEMVAQHKAMRDGMMKMQQDMMAHMMEHMQAGMDSMASCPMMKMKKMGDAKH